MTLKEFLELNTNDGLLDIYLYDKNRVYYGCYAKKYLLKNSGILDEKIISFALDDNDLYIQLAF